jgi:hypothetical protein
MTKAKAREAVETILYLLKGSLENGSSIVARYMCFYLSRI